MGCRDYLSDICYGQEKDKDVGIQGQTEPDQEGVSERDGCHEPRRMCPRYWHH